MTKTSDPPLDSALELYVGAILRKKAFDLVILDVRQLTSITDAFIICSGRSNRQVTAIAEYIQVSLKKEDIKPLSVEGKREGHWVLLDYGHVIIHVFYEPVRDFYDLESLWIDAEKIQAENLTKQAKENG
ncbi:MAG: ribosome silencing factor [Deltaproteobacteria bacterium]|jgi:ribosome-associated protein|nr:ribosome silencing factor [Deltaproteobacteria bacterium]